MGTGNFCYFLGHPIKEREARQLYREAVELLSHVSYAPITLAHVAGMLLVYQVQGELELEEPEWFRIQVQQCADDAELGQTNFNSNSTI